jgi:hypothetical protein
MHNKEIHVTAHEDHWQVNRVEEKNERFRN